ncbi:anchored repeat ABC transporter, substrate-binding protein [Ruania halotolerans]|uniref:anchored repeat ABC transporter, substrate-binding protein n=1 Tax=Ruania halotolerans TaxID=2897773 RepID=UPI001E289E3A|nr:anchored repeat ABC transporter, substrate-binding protein [Ruania halotolerans]UFU05373.1 anchored repeat ABC transporter, substrate-binding protein [Ruania halotolerans]
MSGADRDLRRHPVHSGWGRRRPALIVAAFAAFGTGLAGCAAPAAQSEDEGLSIVTTTGIVADLAENVVGDRMEVTQLVPEGADPHSYEPTLRDVRSVAYADAAFSNYMMLEDQSIIRTVDANLPDGVPNVSLAESAVRYAAEIIPLVENVSLDTIWLGMRVRGTGAELGADRSSQVNLYAVDVSGPGDMFAYLTQTFGEPAFSLDSTDGFDAGDLTRLPPDAHTHMSWAFTEPGIYELTVRAEVAVDSATTAGVGEETTFTFAVGVDPHSVPGHEDSTVLSRGHADVTVDIDSDQIYLFADPHGGGDHTQQEYAAEDVVIDVPTRALHEIPPDPVYRFLGRAGEQIYQLPQAVLGAHVHGEIDPHLWQNVGNAQAYVEIIRDTAIEIDPDGVEEYRANARDYLRELEELDTYVEETIADIPAPRRHLVTTHDAFGYLGSAYDIEIAGFVTPNPSTEPSIQERRRLVQTIQNLQIPAVFLEPNLISRSSTLTQTADELGVRVCPIYGDAFDEEVTTYVEMMRANADSLHECLT